MDRQVACRTRVSARAGRFRAGEAIANRGNANGPNGRKTMRFVRSDLVGPWRAAMIGGVGTPRGIGPTAP
jgi:hypothetical protein